MGGDSLLIELLPARQGDAIVLEWGPVGDRFRMLVDGGPATAYDVVRARLAEYAADGRFELLVLTHIDADHIEGFVLLTNDAELDLEIGEVWFNGTAQLTEELGPVQGEFLGALITGRGLGWNTRFDGAAVAVPPEGDLPAIELPGGLRLTVLGPLRSQLPRLRDQWHTVVADAQLDFGSVEQALERLRSRPKLNPATVFLGGPDAPNVEKLVRAVAAKDTKLPNATSIVLLAEYGDSRVLLAGDVTPTVFRTAVDRLLRQRGVDRLPLNAFKLPHHGSARNLTAPLLRLLPAERYLISSDGTSFNHPDDGAMALVVGNAPAGAELVFNYSNGRTRKWDDEDLTRRYRYRTRYPSAPGQGVITVIPRSAPR